MTLPLEYLPFVALAALLLLYGTAKLAVRWYRRRQRSLSAIYGYSFHTAIRQTRQNVRL